MSLCIAPFGTWTSPISAERAARGARRYADLTSWDDKLFWCEGRPEEGGRNVIVMASADAEKSIDLLPEGFSARSKVHEYGGGAFLVSDAGLFFVNADDQDIYHLPRLDGRTPPERITDEPQLRFADGIHDAARQRLIMVAERRPLDSPGDVENLLVSICLKPASRGQTKTLIKGRDFYAAPRLDPQMGKLAWLEWSLPHMPWEASELWVSELDDTGHPVSPEPVSGGNGSMAGEPHWSADGRLWFIADESGWASLHVQGGHGITIMAHKDHEFGQPMWGLGGRTYHVDGDGTVLAAAQYKGQMRLLRHDGRQWQTVPGDARQVDNLAVMGSSCFGIAASDRAPSSIVNLISSSVISGMGAGFDAADIATGQPVTFRSSGGAASHALYYPPRNSRCTGPEDTAPPMIVSAHGGPTGMADRGLKFKIQYWTSRGFAWLDVDYRGSIGHGRAYRRELDGFWGIHDVDDVAAGARHMADAGLADPDRLLISGSSAGGYTVLQALCETDIFAAGASYYGIGDLAKLLELTHKFESGYLHTLLGLTPANRDRLLQERSPLYHADQISSPVIFFQGTEDNVVPLDQSRDMAASLRQRGTPVCYREFAGEGHGFRRSETIISALEGEYAFYAAILGLEPEETLPPVSIDNFG